MNKTLRTYVRLLAEESINKPYLQSLIDDDDFNETSVLVPDDIKDKICDYLTSMGLFGR